jgi:hypothetical protein
MKYIRSNIPILVILVLTVFVSCEQDNSYIVPVPDFEIQLTDSIAPANVSFLNKSVNLEQFEWDFGDGTISHEKSPYHLFNKDGNFTIILRAWKDNEEFTIQKTIYLSKVYQYFITNNSLFKLYNLTCYSTDSSQYCNSINLGLLNANQSSNKCKTQSENLYISFENDEGLKFKTVFPYSLNDEILNELIIDNFTLIFIDN